MDTLFAEVLAYTGVETRAGLYVGVTGRLISYMDTIPPNEKPARTIDGRRKILMPGLINAHTHLPMTLLRGYADDCALKTWLFDYIIPIEDRMNAQDIRAGTLLALAESLAAGVTSVSDMYNFSSDIAACAAEVGLKANIARGLTCIGQDFDPNTHVGVREAQELYDAWHDYDDGRLRVDACLHGEYTSPPPLWTYTAQWASQRGLRLHLHLSETQEEHEECLTRRGLTPTAALERAGVFNVPVTAAHGVWLTDEDMDILAAHGASVVHCPVSNAKLASGTARVSALRARGVPVAMGTDGAASQNTLDLFQELKMAPLIAKLQGHDPTALTAHDALDMVLKGGAHAQGRQQETGQIAVGCDADLILLDADRPHLTPLHNLESQLTYAASGADVMMTMVRGRVLYEQGVFLTIDMEKLRYDITHSVLPRIMHETF